MLTRLTTIAGDQVGAGDRDDGPQLAATSSTQSLVDLTDLATEVGKKIGPLARQHPRRGRRQQEVEGAAVGQHRPARGVPHRLVQGGRRHQVPRQLGGPALEPGSLLKEGRPSLRLRARPRLRRQPRLALSAPVVVRRARGRQGRQDRAHRLRRDGARPSISPQASTRRRCSRTCSAGPTSTTTRRSSASRSPAPTTPRQHPGGRPSATSRRSPRSPTTRLNPQGPKGRFHMLNPRVPRRSSIHAPDQAAAKAFLRWLIRRQAARRAGSPPADAYYAPFLHALRQPPDVERGAALPALQGVAQDVAPARLAWAAEPRHVRERGQVRRRRHVRQGRAAATSTKDVIATAAAQLEADLQRRSSPMAVTPASLARIGAGRPPAASRCAASIEREGVFGWLMLAPGVLFLLAFVAYPFFYGIFLSLQDRPVAQRRHLRRAARTSRRWRTTPSSGRSSSNTFVYVDRHHRAQDGRRARPWRSVMNQHLPRQEPGAGLPAPAVHRAHRAPARSPGCGSSIPPSA